MKREFFKYDPKGYFTDERIYEIMQSSDRKRTEEMNAWKAQEVCIAICKSKGFSYKTKTLVPAVFVSSFVAKYLYGIIPQTWIKLGIIVEE